MATERERAEIAEAKGAVGRVRAWRWANPEDPQGFDAPPPEPEPSMQLSTKMTQYLVRDVMEQVGGEAMGLHAARRESDVDLKSNGRRVLLAVCKIVLLLDVLLQLVMAAAVAKGAPSRNSTEEIEPPAYVAVPPIEDVNWDADPPRYRPYAAIPEYAASGHDNLELGLLECAPTSHYQRWGVDDGTGAWVTNDNANGSFAENAHARNVQETRVGLLFLLETLSVAASASESRATAICLGCGRKPFPCKSSKLETQVMPEPRRCDLQWPPAFADQARDAAAPDSMAWRVQLPPWGSDLAIRSFLPGTWQSRCIGSSGITNDSDILSVLCGVEGVVAHSELTKLGDPDTSLRLNSPRCPRMSCPAQWHSGHSSALPHQQWKWEVLPEDSDSGAPNVVQNGGFEAPDVSFNDRRVSAADGVVGAWHVFGATQPDKSGAYLGNQWATPYGKQSFRLRADCSSTKSELGVKQQFQAEAGAMYSLEFAASGDTPNCKACDVGRVAVHDKATSMELLVANFTGGGKLERSTSDIIGSPNLGTAAWSRWAFNFTVPRHSGGSLILSFVAVDCVQIDDIRVTSILATWAAASRPSNAPRARWLRQRRGLLRQRFVDWRTGEESEGLCLGLRPKFPRKMQRSVFQPAGYNKYVFCTAMILILLPHIILALLLRRSAMRMCHARLMPAWMQYAFPFDKLEGHGFATRVVPTTEADDVSGSPPPSSSGLTSTELLERCYSAAARRRLRNACWRVQLFIRFNTFCILVGPLALIVLDACLVRLYLKNHRGSTRAAIASASYQRAQQFVVAHDRLRLFVQAGCIGVPQIIFQLYLWASLPRFTDTIPKQLREYSFAFTTLSVLLVVLHLKLESISHGAGSNTKQHAEELMKVTLGVLPKLAEIRSGQCTAARYDGLEISPAQVQELATVLRSAQCRLTSLSLAKCNIGDDGMVTLGAALRDNASLTHLDLRENDITPRGKVMLENALDAADEAHQKKGRRASDHTRMQYVDIDSDIEDSGEKVSDEPAIFVGVRYLAFDEWAIHPPPSLQFDASADADQMQCRPRHSEGAAVTTADAPPTVLIAEPSNVEQEDEPCASNEQHGKRIVVGLARKQFAASVSDELDVDFSHSKIGPTDAPLLARCLSRGCSLRLCTLNLSHNPLGGRRPKMIDFDKMTALAASKQGRHAANAGFVDMAGDDAMYEADVTGVVALASVVRCCTALTSLDLAAAQLCGSPDCGSPLTEGIVAIAEAMAGARKLALVDLSGNNITAWNGLYGMDSRSDTAGIDAVTSALDANPSLGLVVMRRNKIGFATQTRLRERYRLSGRLQL